MFGDVQKREFIAYETPEISRSTRVRYALIGMLSLAVLAYPIFIMNDFFAVPHTLQKAGVVHDSQSASNHHDVADKEWHRELEKIDQELDHLKHSLHDDHHYEYDDELHHIDEELKHFSHDSEHDHFSDHDDQFDEDEHHHRTSLGCQHSVGHGEFYDTDSAHHNSGHSAHDHHEHPSHHEYTHPMSYNSHLHKDYDHHDSSHAYSMIPSQYKSADGDKQFSHHQHHEHRSYDDLAHALHHDSNYNTYEEEHVIRDIAFEDLHTLKFRLTHSLSIHASLVHVLTPETMHLDPAYVKGRKSYEIMAESIANLIANLPLEKAPFVIVETSPGSFILKVTRKIPKKTLLGDFTGTVTDTPTGQFFWPYYSSAEIARLHAPLH